MCFLSKKERAEEPGSHGLAGAGRVCVGAGVLEDAGPVGGRTEAG